MKLIVWHGKWMKDKIVKMNKEITVTRVETTEQFEQLRDEWNTLLFQTPEKDVFLTWEWQFAWWKHIGQNTFKLSLLIIRENEDVIGIAPLMSSIKKKRFTSFRWLENIGNPDCDVGGLIALDSEKIMKALLQYLEEHKYEWDVFELMEINLLNPSTQKILSVINQSQLNTYQMDDKHFYIPFTEQTWEDYYKSLSKNMKHNLKRRTKRINEMGTVTYKKYGGDELTFSNFEEMFILSEKSNFPDLYRTEQLRGFHKSLFEYMQKQEWLQIEMLYVNERPIAFQYGFCFENRYEDWRGGIDKEFETLAPGKLLMMFSLEERFKRGLQENDFLRGVYSYKMDWNPLYRMYANIQIYNRANIKTRLAYWWLRYIKPKLDAWMNKEEKETDEVKNQVEI